MLDFRGFFLPLGLPEPGILLFMLTPVRIMNDGWEVSV